MTQTSALEWLATHGLDACELDDRKPVQAALASVPQSARSRDPACLAVQAALERFEGHVDTAITLYERALTHAMEPALEVRIRENLAHLFLSRRQDADCEKVLEKALALSPDDPRILSLEAAARARRRDARTIEDLAILEPSLFSLSDLERARIYRRLASAIYEVSGDFSESERYLHLVIEHAEVAGAHWHSAVAYGMLASLYSNHVGDNARVLDFSDLAVEAATKAGDKGFLAAIMVNRYGLAAEVGDKALVESLGERLRATQGPERYAERMAIVFGDALSYGWSGAFDTMRQYLLSVNIGRVIVPQRAVFYALTAIAHAGAGYEQEALKIAYRAISLGRPLAREPLYEARLRLIARCLSGCVLLYSNRRTEAIRALNSFESRMTPSVICLRDAVLSGRYDPVRTRAPEVYGYAMLCEALGKTAESAVSDAQVKLTKREIDILRAASGGRNARAIAEELAIAETTVEWHRKNLLKKLGVNSTLAAVTKGRELQIIP